eukprot:2472150-Pleurochrysis_carterae.AAC.1
MSQAEWPEERGTQLTLRPSDLESTDSFRLTPGEGQDKHAAWLLRTSLESWWTQTAGSSRWRVYSTRSAATPPPGRARGGAF